MKIEVIKKQTAPIDYRLLTKYAVDFLLGDGYIGIGGKEVNGRMKIAHTEAQKDYVYFKANVLSALTDVTIYRYDRKGSEKSYNPKSHYLLQTKSHPIFTDIHNKMYPLGIKALYPNFVNQMDWESFAYLYMDDGSICDNSNGTPVCKISTESFTYADHLLIQSKANALGFTVNIRKRKQNNKVYWYLRFPSNQIDYFLEGIKPYMLPCFEYKTTIKR